MFIFGLACNRIRIELFSYLFEEGLDEAEATTLLVVAVLAISKNI